MSYYDQQPEQQPPQHPAAAYYPAPAYAVAPPKDLTVFAILAFAFPALFTIFSVVVASVTKPAIEHIAAVETDYDWTVGVYSVGVVLGWLALVAGFVTGSLWLFRARRNAEAMEPGREFVRSAGWAWGGWVCPVVNLWFPFQVVRDTHRALAPLGTSVLVGWWWAFFLLQNFGLRIARSVESKATAADASTAQGWEIFASVAMVVALVLWGLVLRTVTKEQHDRMYGRTRS